MGMYNKNKKETPISFIYNKEDIKQMEIVNDYTKNFFDELQNLNQEEVEPLTKEETYLLRQCYGVFDNTLKLSPQLAAINGQTRYKWANELDKIGYIINNDLRAFLKFDEKYLKGLNSSMRKTLLTIYSSCMELDKFKLFKVSYKVMSERKLEVKKLVLDLHDFSKLELDLIKKEKLKKMRERIELLEPTSYKMTALEFEDLVYKYITRHNSPFSAYDLPQGVLKKLEINGIDTIKDIKNISTEELRELVGEKHNRTFKKLLKIRRENNEK